MVSLSDGAMTVENAGMYYQQHYSSIGEYYAPSDQPAIGQTLGKGAEALGLGRNISAEQFDAILRGIDPTSGVQLRAKPKHNQGEQRAGWDITLSPPKSISIQALVAGDTRLIEADRQAAIRAIQEAEACALGRRRGGREWVQSGNVVAVMFEHHDARESINGEHGPMPQLHHHTFIANLTQLPNGQWRGLEPKEIYKARRFIDSIYMTELANRVQQLGYQIERGPKGAFELAGYTRDQILAFSERFQDVEREKAAQGITDPRGARDIITKTRKAKREHDPAALKAEREALARQYGIALDNFPTQAVAPSIGPEIQAQESLNYAINHMTSRQAVVDHRDMITAALRHRVGMTDLDHVRAAITAQQKAGNLMPDGASVGHPLDAYTTREMVRLEAENLTLVRDRMNHGRAIVGLTIRNPKDGTLSSTGTPEVERWAAAKGLLPDQTQVAITTLTTPKWASTIEGLAGTTKTTTVGAVKGFAEGHGWTVYGFGTTTTSANALQEGGIESQTIAKALLTPLPPKSGHELWIVDESSLLATRNVNKLLKLAHERGIERIVFVGDQNQHPAIEAGAPVRQFLADNMVVAQLTTIRRQKDPELRQVVELVAARRIPEAIDKLIEQQRVTAIADVKQRYERIADSYVDAHEAGHRILVVSPANDERRALNQTIRAKLVGRGFVNTIGREHDILIPIELTPAQQKDAGSYAEGNILYFVRRDKALAIASHSYLSVSAVHDHALALRADDGRLIEFHPARAKYVQAYAADTRTIAPGDRLEWREADKRRRIPNHAFATITGMDSSQIQVKFDNGRTLSMPIADARKVDLGYASTSHAAQGATVERVIVNIGSKRSPELVNQQQTYVSLSRPSLDAHVYTDSIDGMRRAVQRRIEKSLALDVVEKPRQQQRHSTALRI
jgi:conjugative relaxase-like TrwC/TraI family protein